MQRTVLLVEDNPGDARLIREMLAEAQDKTFRLERVDRLAAGIERLTGPGVSAILLDLSLPDSQGLETFRTLHERAAGVPIVVLTGLDDETLGLSAIREGAQDYLVKGQVNGHLLVRALRYAIERKRQEEAQRFLAELSRTLSSSLDYETTLNQVARLALPALADYCVVDVLEDGAQLRQAAAAHVDPTLESRLRDMRRMHPPRSSTLHPIWQVIRSGRPVVVSEIPESMLVEVAHDDEHLSGLRSLQTTSCVIVPLIARGRTMGTISFARVAGNRELDAFDVILFEELGRRAALAIDNAQLYAQAQEASRLRDTVLSSVSHDLRNPLMIVKVIAETLKLQIEQLNLPGGRDLIEGLVRVDATTVKMTGLIDELLDVARMQAGEKVKLSRRRTDLVALVHATVAEYRSRASRYRIDVDLAESTLIGFWDAARIERVLGNLLSNAIKYSAPGSAICVRLSADADGESSWAVLDVQDHGVGIPAADLPHIFTWFHRGRNVVDRVPGAGIGLAGARQIVEQHGGTMTVESVEGAGSTFRVRLPLAVEAVADTLPEATT